MWIKSILAACFIVIAICHDADVKILDQRFANGDENDIVSVDLKKKDGTEDIRVVAQLKFHLNNKQVYVNGHPIIHGVVNSLHMLISIVEIEKGIKRTPRLAPVTFRVLVREEPAVNGGNRLIVEEEFTQVEQYEVLQFDVKQIIWEGTNRKPLASIKLLDSKIHRCPHEEDHRVLGPGLKPRLPEHGLIGDEEEYGDHHKQGKHGHHHSGKHGHHHHRHHSRIGCWFHKLTIGGKIAVVSAAVLIMFGLILSLVICYKRHCTHTKHLHVTAPIDDQIEINGCDEKKDNKDAAKDDAEFHIQFNECYVDVSDKKDLIN